MTLAQKQTKGILPNGKIPARKRARQPFAMSKWLITNFGASRNLGPLAAHTLTSAGKPRQAKLAENNSLLKSR
jgi:hypothetical protein